MSRPSKVYLRAEENEAGVSVGDVEEVPSRLNPPRCNLAVAIRNDWGYRSHRYSDDEARAVLEGLLRWKADEEEHTMFDFGDWRIEYRGPKRQKDGE